jgi:FAD:protein FMN transferase
MTVVSAVEAESGPMASVVAPRMGGQLGVHLQAELGTSVDAAQRIAGAVHRRIGVWADRLSRFSDDSDLSRLNASPAARLTIRPTLAAVLDWGRRAAQVTGGIVDVTMLEARLDAEAGRGDWSARPAADDRAWAIHGRGRGATIQRRPGLQFDLDGVAKGWLADRGLALLEEHRAALVDADGDIAVSLREGASWMIAVADPRDRGSTLAMLELIGLTPSTPHRFGVATSGTSVHRWPGLDGPRHHLIDPRTGRSAVTDVVQATVLARSAAEAEAFAKAIVILGSEDALQLLDRPGVGEALILTERGDVLATPTMRRWLA